MTYWNASGDYNYLPELKKLWEISRRLQLDWASREWGNFEEGFQALDPCYWYEPAKVDEALSIKPCQGLSIHWHRFEDENYHLVLEIEDGDYAFGYRLDGDNPGVPFINIYGKNGIIRWNPDRGFEIDREPDSYDWLLLKYICAQFCPELRAQMIRQLAEL